MESGELMRSMLAAAGAVLAAAAIAAPAAASAVRRLNRLAGMQGPDRSSMSFRSPISPGLGLPGRPEVT